MSFFPNIFEFKKVQKLIKSHNWVHGVGGVGIEKLFIVIVSINWVRGVGWVGIEKLFIVIVSINWLYRVEGVGYSYEVIHCAVILRAAVYIDPWVPVNMWYRSRHPMAWSRKSSRN